MTFSSNNFGNPAYFSSYLTRVREALPDFPLDPVIFQSVLLCLIAGGSHGEQWDPFSRGSKHLILRTSPEDVGLVLNITTLVSPSRCLQSFISSPPLSIGRHMSFML